jgi:hypothetical protein
MFSFRRLASIAVAASLLTAGPVLAEEQPAPPTPATPAPSEAPPAPPSAPAMTGPVALSLAEAEALKLKLIQAKPNLNTVTLFSFLAPGSGQAYMGHIDRSFLMWGGYLVGFTAIKVAVPETAVSAAGGPKISDLAITGLFLGIATASALDAYFLALKERQEYDALINRLTEKLHPTVPPKL